MVAHGNATTNYCLMHWDGERPLYPLSSHLATLEGRLKSCFKKDIPHFVEGGKCLGFLVCTFLGYDYEDHKSFVFDGRFDAGASTGVLSQREREAVRTTNATECGDRDNMVDMRSGLTGRSGAPQSHSLLLFPID